MWYMLGIIHVLYYISILIEAQYTLSTEVEN